MCDVRSVICDYKQIETLFWINKPWDEEFIKSRITEAAKKEFEIKKILPPLTAARRRDHLKTGRK